MTFRMWEGNMAGENKLQEVIIKATHAHCDVWKFFEWDSNHKSQSVNIPKDSGSFHQDIECCTGCQRIKEVEFSFKILQVSSFNHLIMNVCSLWMFLLH